MKIKLFLRVFRRILVAFFLFLCGFSSFSQVEIEEEGPRIGSTILNDTTENIYGPTTARYFFYDDVLNNTSKSYTIDTSLYNIHQFGFVDVRGRRYQDLGNMGTAARHVFFEFEENIGRTNGFNVYDLYYDDEDDIAFFNTISPYSRLGVVLGGAGRALTEVSYTRNINPRTNIGFNYRGLFVDKQIERAKRGDRNAEGIYYNFHGNYTSKNNKYRALAAFIRNNQKVDEYGGVRDATDSTLFRAYYQDTIKVSLGNTEVSDLRRTYFFYHEYELMPFVELFHEFKHFDQQIELTSLLDTEPDSAFLPDRILTDAELEVYGDGVKIKAIKDRLMFAEYSNRIGLAGTVGPGFYKIYIQRRSINYSNRFLKAGLLDSLNLFSTEDVENQAGVMMRIGNAKDAHLIGNFDFLEGGYYDFNAKIAYKLIYGGLRQMKRKPTLLETAYRSNFNQWYLLPDAPLSSEISGGIFVDNPRFSLTAGARYQRLYNKIYFIHKEDRTSKAVQNEGSINVLMPNITFKKWFGDHWLVSGEVVYSMVGGANPEVHPLPEIFTNFIFSYNRVSFDDNLEWQLGLDTHWKSEYYAPGYDPLIQQFYVQDEFLVPDIPLMDVFLNARINKARIFLKFTNIFQFIAGYGYMPTPYYPGQVGTLDFGFNWSFYD